MTKLKTDVSTPQVIGLVGHELFEYYLKNDQDLITRDRNKLDAALIQARAESNKDK